VLTGRPTRRTWLPLLLFFAFLPEAVSAAESDACSFSLKQENPKHINFTVQSGRIAFLCKSDGFFLRGTVTRTLGWQLTGKIFESMAERLKAETLEKWPSGRLYRIVGEKQTEQKSLICGYHNRDKYSIDLCAPEGHGGPRGGAATDGNTTPEGHGGPRGGAATDGSATPEGHGGPRGGAATDGNATPEGHGGPRGGAATDGNATPEGHGGPRGEDRARRLVSGILQEFRKIPLEESPLLKSAPLYSQKKVFTEENETREPALLALSMPPGYVEVTRRDNRSLFTDAAGLAEMEIFYEISDLSLDSELAHKVYRKSISAFLSKQGSWRPERDDNLEKSGEANCLLFTDNAQRLSHYCYTVIPVTIAGKKKFWRIAFVAAFLREAVDRSKLLTEQQGLLTDWAAVIRRHSN
jgi:hypothetical protein